MTGNLDWFLWYQIGAMIVTCMGAVGFAYYKWVRLYFEAHFYRRASAGSTSYERIGSKEFKKTDEIIKFRKKSFPVNLRALCERDRNKTLLKIDFDTGDVLQYGGYYRGGNASLVDNILSSGALDRIVRAFTGLDRYTMIIIMILLVACALCFALGLFVSPVVMPQSMTVVNGTVPIPTV